MTLTQSLYKCIHTIKNAHLSSVYAITSLSHNRFASSGIDGFIKIWSTNKPYNLISTLKVNKKEIVSPKQLNKKEKMISLSWDETLTIWNLITYQCESILQDVYGPNMNSIIQTSDGKIIVGGDKVLSIVNEFNLKIEAQVPIDDIGCIYCVLQVDKNKYYSEGTLDGFFLWYENKRI